MQSKRLILILSLMLSMTAVSAWGAEEPVVDEEEGSTSLQPSNIEGWEEDESEPSFFGMGFETRNLGVAPPGGAPGGNEAGSATGGGGGGGKK